MKTMYNAASISAPVTIPSQVLPADPIAVASSQSSPATYSNSR